MIHRTKFASDPYLPSLIHNLECCPTVINFGQNQLTIQKFTTIHQFQNHIFPSSGKSSSNDGVAWMVLNYIIWLPMFSAIFLAMPINLKNSVKEYIQDRSKMSSIKSKLDAKLFIDLHPTLYELWTWNCFCFAELARPFTNCTKHVNQQRIGRPILA